jgi:hypothetical protein
VNASSIRKDSNHLFDEKLVFKYPFNSTIQFSDIYFHPSSNFIVVKNTENDYLIFDFTLNLYYIMHNSKITFKLKMNLFNPNETVKQILLKPYEINYFLKSQSDLKLMNINEFKVDNNIQNALFTRKINNNSMFFYDGKNITGIFIEISSKFIQTNKPKIFNPLLDEFQLLKNHLRGQNYESAFKILTIIQNFNYWIQSLFLIINKLCHSPTNILLIKKHTLASMMEYLREKVFEDDQKTQSVNNIKILCFTNLVYRCLSIKQYEYAYLIAEKLSCSFLYKIIAAHAKLNKFSGISFLASNKLEDTMHEAEDSIMTDLNKIIQNSSYVLSQNNLQILLKDIDHLLENNSLNSEYIKEFNGLEINLASKILI